MRLGILGGGQLGRMLGIAAHRLDVEPHVFAPAHGPATAVTRTCTVAAWDDEAALESFARQVDVVTYEVEALPIACARFLQRHVPVHPSPDALACVQDRLAEKRMLSKHGIAVADFAAVGADPTDAPSGAERADITELGFPLIVKSRFGGYDGRGQVTVHDAAELQATNLQGRLVAERRVPWDRELSVVAVRTASDERRYYDVAENHHRGGILRWSIAPAPALNPDQHARLLATVDRIFEAFDYVGVLGVEFFQVGDTLLVNEVAPRVHNSGHWTIEGAVTSQFENHVRACCGMPLGSTDLIAPTAMLNLIGDFDRDRLLRLPGCHLHLYGKAPRPGRKLGHVTLVRRDAHRLQAEVEELAAKLGPGS